MTSLVGSWDTIGYKVLSHMQSLRTEIIDALCDMKTLTKMNILCPAAG